MNVTYNDGNPPLILPDVEIQDAMELVEQMFRPDGRNIEEIRFFRNRDKMSNGKPFDPAKVPLTDQFGGKR